METVVRPGDPKLGEAINLLCQLENRLDAMRMAASKVDKLEAVQWILLDILEFSHARLSDDSLATAIEPVRRIIEQTKEVDASLLKSQSTFNRLFGRTDPASEVAKKYESLRQVYVTFIGGFFSSLAGSLDDVGTKKQALLEGADAFVEELSRVW